MLLRVNGFYGHVRRNDLRSAAMFGGFLLAFQLVAAVLLFLPLVVFDVGHAPLVLVFGFAGVFDCYGYLTRYAPIVLVAGCMLFLFRFLRHVASVRSTVAFRYVDRWTEPRLVNAVEVRAIAAGLPLPKVGLIDSPARNAFACGLGARSSVVVATRGLLEALDDDELAAVVAHEIAHIKNGDTRLMAAADILMEDLEWLRRRNPFRIAGYGRAVLAVLLPPFLFLCLAAAFATFVAFTLARVSRLLISSSREFVADAEAVRMTHDPAALISALRRIEGRSAVAGVGARTDAMMIDGAVEGPFASHPTVAERVAVLARLSGGMAHVPPARGHARPPAAERSAGPGSGGGFGRRAAPAPSRSLVGRVNAGRGDNFLGLTPKLGVAMGAAFALFLALCLYTNWNLQSQFDRLPGERVAPVVEYPREGIFMVRAALNTGSAEQRRLQRLAEADPVGARCFFTDAYEVGDRGLHPVQAPDPKLVEAYSAGTAGAPSEIKLERYLGHKLRSVRAVAHSKPADHDGALAGYVQQRKTLLQVLHRFFGEPGLALLRDAYGSPEDRAVLAALRRRLDEGAPALVDDKRLAAEIELLLSSPETFMPCLARAD